MPLEDPDWSSIDVWDTLDKYANPICATCDGIGYVDDPSACGDEDHCGNAVVPCPECIVGVWV